MKAYENWQQWRWKKLQERIDNCKNNLFKNHVKELIKYKNNTDQRDNIYQLLDLACFEIDKVSEDEQEHINTLINYTSLFLNTNYNWADHKKKMRECSKALDDHRNWPNWLQKLVGIVLLIVTIALIAAAIALVISLTGGTVGALIAALVKPVIDIIAASCVGASLATATGLTATTAATASLIGAGAMVAIGTGLGSYCSMYKPYTNCIEKIIKEDSTILVR